MVGVSKVNDITPLEAFEDPGWFDGEDVVQCAVGGVFAAELENPEECEACG